MSKLLMKEGMISLKYILNMTMTFYPLFSPSGADNFYWYQVMKEFTIWDENADSKK